MAPAPTRPSHGINEYLALERQSEERHQYVDGPIYAMAGESLEHSVICFNLNRILGPTAGRSLPRPFAQHENPQRPPATGQSPRFHDEHRYVLLNPTLLIRGLLSPVTGAFDRGEKFQRYRTHLDSLNDYVPVSTESL